MAANPEVLRLLGQVRLELDSRVDETTRALVSAWARAWDEIEGEWQAAIEAAYVVIGDGAWPSYAQIARIDRVKRAAAVTREQLLGLTAYTGVTVAATIPTITAAGAEWERLMVAAQMPPTAVAPITGVRAGLSVDWNRVDARAVDAIVRRSTGQIHAFSRPISADAEEQLKGVLTRGILFGDNPRTAAANLLSRVNGAFDGGLNRALVLTRTEMIDAHRAAAWAADKANPKTVTGWTWWAVLDERTCPSCWSLHGSEHPPDEVGPNDHPQGRCARVPTTVSWADLGFTDIPEPAPITADAEATFNNLPEASQLAIFGRDRLDLYNSGRISWSDLSTTKHAAGWRDSQVATPVKDLRKAAAA